MALISRYIITQRNTLFGQATNGKCTNKKLVRVNCIKLHKLLFCYETSSQNKQLNQSLHSNKKKTKQNTSGGSAM